MAVAHWRRMRVWSLEKALFLQETLKRQDAAWNRAAACKSAQAGDGENGINDEGDDGETPITHLAHSFRSLADESHALELLNRYETRYGREYLRALGCFNNQRDRKTARREAKGRDLTQPSPGCLNNMDNTMSSSTAINHPDSRGFQKT